MSIYHGNKFGFVQSAVYDQQGIALEGRLANASDINLCDAVTIGEANGIGVGLGVSVAALSGAKKPGINDTKLVLPTSSSTADDFAGILVRTDTGRTDANGKNYMGYQEVGTLLRADRVGGRIWVRAYDQITTGGDLYWIIDNSVDSDQIIGAFCGAEIKDSTDIDSVKITNAKVVAGAAAGELALVELLG